MHIKNHLISALIFLVAGMTWANSAFAWTATINAEGDDTGGVFQYTVEIGIDTVASIVPSPPPPAGLYSVKMDLMNLPGNNPPIDYALLSKDVRAVGEASYMWILQIDPNGNAIPSSQARTTTMSWDPDEFGSGNFEMRLGFDGTGPVVVADMKTTTSYPVTGTADTQFTIHFTTAFIPPVILLLLLDD